MRPGSEHTWAEDDKYAKTLSLYRSFPEAQPYFDKAYGYALFPTVGKGGIGIRGTYGKGKVYRGGAVTGTATLAQVSIGFQMGGQAFSEIIFSKISALTMNSPAAPSNSVPMHPWPR